LQSILDEFSQLVEQAGLQRLDEKVLGALEKVWSDVSERFQPGTVLLAHNKKARQDTTTWMQQRLKLSSAQRDDNAKLLAFFDQQVCLLLEIHGHVCDLAQSERSSREAKESLQLQLSKL